MTLETMQAVVVELQNRGIDATLEYPGFIATTSNADQPTTIHWGDCSEEFTALIDKANPLCGRLGGGADC